MYKNVNTKPLSKVVGELAVLSRIRSSSLGMSRLDRQASLDSDAAHQAKRGAAKTNVSRMPGCESVVDDIKKDHRLARDMLIGYTTQWGVTTAACFPTFVSAMSPASSTSYADRTRTRSRHSCRRPRLHRREPEEPGLVCCSPAQRGGDRRVVRSAV